MVVGPKKRKKKSESAAQICFFRISDLAEEIAVSANLILTHVSRVK